ncbi:MAG: radical SAM protein [Myxococcota bacterium]
MRVARVVTNETCNQACRFCNARRPHERVSIASSSAIRARLAEAREQGTEVLLTGGEPTRRPDLPNIVRGATAQGSRVVLETNAALIDSRLARALADAGLDAARVHLPAWGPRLDAITRDPGGAAATQRGLLALQEAGIDIEGCSPVVRDNLESLPLLPAQLSDAGIELQRLWIRLPRSAPDPSALAPLDAMVATTQALVHQARAHALPISLDAGTYLPPCLFERPSHIASIYALTSGGAERSGYRRPDACAECAVRDRCPGLPEDLPETVARPITNERLRRRLTVIESPTAQIERELVTREILRRPDGSTVPSHVVRIGFRCNQACHFCFVSTHLPAPAVAQVEAAIDEIADQGGVLVLSGGEPTLDPRLPEYIRRGKDRGASEVELQTNATRLDAPGYCQTLCDAGLDFAFISLHGATAEVSDRVTDAPGTFDRSVAGIDALAATPVRIHLNFVFCELNREQFPDFVQLVADRWPQVEITVSFVGMSTDLVPRQPWLVPRYRDVIPALQRGLALARRHGLSVGGFDSMCGLPLCLVPGDLREFFSLAQLPSGYDGGEFVKPAPCTRCVLQPRCFGLRRAYATMYGWDELQPVTQAPPEP